MSLVLTDLRLTYPDGDRVLTALDGVSLEVAAGQLVAVVGPSGSGKSSLLAVAATLLRPDAGRVLVDGVDTGGLSAAQRARLRLEKVGIVFQQPNLLASLTAVEQLLAAHHMRGGSVRRQRRAAAELLAAVGLDGKQHRRPHQLSGGERQRVNIARALSGRPAVLLVDEPTAALDHDRGAQIVELLAEVTRQHQVATVMVTHDTEHLDQVDEVVEMRDGRLSALSGRR
ncbi:putative ABC transport system ATP-binding protein [Saccharopolyspora kobensis]|uniref:ABC transport system ATP-binding protein n=1 Tax=Saccharopolyspora kobensis TaxID=146035 RepID=A0A1H5WKB0_9PSEU|nr:ABC transporter ATP-binding protein [Saccharopolyspora kobensis]SEF99803.1 putative ABC transport system ATP-binding protein [Saccharopolyspora kobensis]SFD76520.1 putative ABC transport system ATP-binding protein [Saccharopolyspora kobensis]